MMLSPTCQLIHGQQTLNLLKAESHVKNNQKTDWYLPIYQENREVEGKDTGNGKSCQKEQIFRNIMYGMVTTVDNTIVYI